MPQLRYTTPHGIIVTRSASTIRDERGLKPLLHELDSRRGVYLSSGYEFPGRYSRSDFASTRPPLEMISAGREVLFRPLNERGAAINLLLESVLESLPAWDKFQLRDGELRGTLKPMPKLFAEEERSKQPSVFSILRALTEEFRNEQDQEFALIGTFGYDLLFQFEPVELKLPRYGHKDLHLFLCDDIYHMDRKLELVQRFEYDLSAKECRHAGWNEAHNRFPPRGHPPQASRA